MPMCGRRRCDASRADDDEGVDLSTATLDDIVDDIAGVDTVRGSDAERGDASTDAPTSSIASSSSTLATSNQ